MAIPLQAYFGNTECSALSYKKIVILHEKHGLGQADNRAGKGWICSWWQKMELLHRSDISAFLTESSEGISPSAM